MPESEERRPRIGPFVYTCLLAVLNVVYFGASLIASHITHCLTLRVDANYILFIAGSLIVSMIDLKLRNIRTLKKTFGWARIEFVGSLFNATFLASLSFSAAVEAIQQLIHLTGHADHSHGVHPDQAIKIIIFGLVRFVLGLTTFATRLAIRDSHTQFRVNYTQNAGVELCVVSPLNHNCQNAGTEKRKPLPSPVLLPSVPFALLREFVGPASILIVGILVKFYGVHIDHALPDVGNNILNSTSSGMENLTASPSEVPVTPWYLYLDPAICLMQVLVLALTMFYNAKESGLALMLTIPRHVDLLSLQKKLMQRFPFILDIHDFHLWRSSIDEIVVTCHLICTSLADYVRNSSEIDCFFKGEGIAQVTIQPEVYASENSDPEINETMTPNACACCEASPKCCSLKETKEQMSIRRRTISRPTDDMVDLEIGNNTPTDSGTDEPP